MLSKMQVQRKRRREKLQKPLLHRNLIIETDLTVLKWMVGFNLAATLGILIMLFRLQSP